MLFSCALFAVFLTFLSLVASSAQASPGFGKPIYGRKYLNQTQAFPHGPGMKPSTIKYNVEHHDDVVHFRQAEYGVKKARCTAEQMVLSFASHEAMAKFYTLVNGVEGNSTKILAGGCLDMNNLDIIGVCSKVLDTKIRQDLHKRSKTIVVRVRPADWDEVFVNADIFASIQPQYAKASGRRLGSECDKSEPECETDVGKEFKLPGFKRNLNGKQLAEWGALSVTCEQCEVDFQPTINFALKIKWLKLQHAKLMVSGDLNAAVVLKAFAQFSGNSHNEKILASLKFPDIVFSVGVLPIRIQFAAPIKASYYADFDAKATLTAGLTASIKVDGGLAYTNGKFGRIGGFTPVFRAVEPHLDAEANVYATLSAGCDLQLSVNNIMHGHLDISPTVRFTGKSVVDTPDVDMNAKLDGNLKITVGGELGVRIKNRNIGPRLKLADKGIVNSNRTLWKGELSFDTDEMFDFMEDEVVSEQYYDEDDEEPVTFRVRDTSGLVLAIPEEDRID
jgi:hypothetical protein